MTESNMPLERIAREDFLKIVDEMNEVINKIPKDKDCKKCPYSDNGHSLGMMTPCFDICDEMEIAVEPYAQ